MELVEQALQIFKLRSVSLHWGSYYGHILYYLVVISVNISIICAKLFKSIVFSFYLYSPAKNSFFRLYLNMQLSYISQKYPNYTGYSPIFTGMVNLDCIDSNLTEIRKNDFISGVYYNNMFTLNNNIYKKERINKYLQELGKISPDESSTKLLKDHANDAACKLAAIEKYRDAHNINTLIINKFPELLYGLQLNQIVESLDTLSYAIRDNYQKYQDEDNYFKIGDKTIHLEYAGKGCNSIVFKLFDNSGHKTAMKVYINPEEVGSYSIWGELAVYHDLKDIKINNIPELYLANPLVKQVDDCTKSSSTTDYIADILDYDADNSDTSMFKDYDGYKGGWTLIEYIDDNSSPKAVGQTLQEWLKDNNLIHYDMYSADNVKNGYIIDLGGIGI